MKTILLISFLFSLAACNSSNKTAEKVSLSAYEKKAFLSLPHEENASILRNKLLNIMLTRQMNLKDESVVEEKDHFDFTNDKFSLSSKDVKDFRKQKSLSSEIIVSYKDHLEFYFVPAGLTSDQSLSELHLNSVEGKNLVWVFGKPSILEKRQCYYLVQATKEELLKNDFSFIHTHLKDNESVANSALSYRLTNNQKVVMHFQLNFLLKETRIAEVRGVNRSCKKDEREAGICDEPCTAKIESESGNLIKREWKDENIPLIFMINGKILKAEELNAYLNSDHTLTVSIELSQYTNDATVDLQVLPIKMPGVFKPVQGFDYSVSCRSAGWLKSTLDLTPQVQNVFQVDVYGREMKI